MEKLLGVYQGALLESEQNFHKILINYSFLQFLQILRKTSKRLEKLYYIGFYFFLNCPFNSFFNHFPLRAPLIFEIEFYWGGFHDWMCWGGLFSGICSWLNPVIIRLIWGVEIEGIFSFRFFFRIADSRPKTPGATEEVRVWKILNYPLNKSDEFVISQRFFHFLHPLWKNPKMNSRTSYVSNMNNNTVLLK